MCLSSERIVTREGIGPRPETPARTLHSIAATRQLEEVAATSQPTLAPASLMQRAGLACAQLALATAPHAQRFWVACGPGNNGGDGLEAAAHLQAWGKQVTVSRLPGMTTGKMSVDAACALQAARQAGVTLSDQPPEVFDACMDALFGIGPLRPWSDPHAQWIQAMNGSAKPVLAVDVPSGLNADTGAASGLIVRATHTLSLLTLKPGLFMGHGRDACGDIWFNPLGTRHSMAPQALLLNPPRSQTWQHASHKGSQGDVCVVGGTTGMTGAALLAAAAALHGGAGRVYTCLLGPDAPMFAPSLPEVMIRAPGACDWTQQTVVAGCGGGDAIGALLPQLLEDAQRLVLDADGLNALSASPSLAESVRQRRPGSTILTPHPLEAARLLGGSTTQVQADRLRAAKALAQKYVCTVVLKGSGSVVCGPDTLACINPSGNGKLATAGTGDVLAGLIGAHWARGISAHEAASRGVYQHGAVADRWPEGHPLTAGTLAGALCGFSATA